MRDSISPYYVCACAIVSFLASSLHCACAKDVDVQSHHRNAVRVFCTKGENRSVASGFFTRIEDNQLVIVTAAHSSVPGGVFSALPCKYDKEIACEVAAIDVDHDLLILVPAKGMERLELEGLKVSKQHELQIGCELWLFGGPEALPLQSGFKKGTLSRAPAAAKSIRQEVQRVNPDSALPVHDDTILLLHSVSAGKGYSGGPLLAAESGEVVGLHNAEFPECNQEFLAIASVHIETLLARVDSGKTKKVAQLIPGDKRILAVVHNSGLGRVNPDGWIEPVRPSVDVFRGGSRFNGQCRIVSSDRDYIISHLAAVKQVDDGLGGKAIDEVDASAFRLAECDLFGIRFLVPNDPAVDSCSLGDGVRFSLQTDKDGEDSITIQARFNDRELLDAESAFSAMAIKGTLPVGADERRMVYNTMCFDGVFDRLDNQILADVLLGVKERSSGKRFRFSLRDETSVSAKDAVGVALWSKTIVDVAGDRAIEHRIRVGMFRDVVVTTHVSSTGRSPKADATYGVIESSVWFKR